MARDEKTRAVRFSRRRLLGGFASLGAVAVMGCKQAAKNRSQASAAASKTAAGGRLAMTVYRDPSCGCCEAWADLADKAGYQVQVIDRPDMPAIKARYGIPEELRSCHTAIVGGYAVEGHVPLDRVARLLEERPAGIKGLAVAGMPPGSPGMELPDGTKDPFTVMAFGGSGRISPFTA